MFCVGPGVFFKSIEPYNEFTSSRARTYRVTVEFPKRGSKIRKTTPKSSEIGIRLLYDDKNAKMFEILIQEYSKRRNEF